VPASWKAKRPIAHRANRNQSREKEFTERRLDKPKCERSGKSATVHSCEEGVLSGMGGGEAQRRRGRVLKKQGGERSSLTFTAGAKRELEGMAEIPIDVKKKWGSKCGNRRRISSKSKVWVRGQEMMRGGFVPSSAMEVTVVRGGEGHQKENFNTFLESRMEASKKLRSGGGRRSEKHRVVRGVRSGP